MRGSKESPLSGKRRTK